MAVLLALIEIVISGWTFFGARDTVWETLEQSTAMQARGLAIAVGDSLAERDYGAMESRIRQTMSDQSILSALVSDREGKVLSFLRRAQGQVEPTLVFDAPRLLPEPEPETNTHNGDPQRDDHQITRWAPINFGHHIGWVQLKMSTEKSEAAIAKLRRKTLIMAALGVLTGLALLFLFLSRLYRQVLAHDKEMMQSQLDLEEEVTHDHLTGLANRNLLHDRMQQDMSRALRKNELLAVCFLDLDGFKAINDQLGHEVGDLLLREVASRLAVSVRAEDTVARLGGDEFVMLLADGTNCELILKRVLAALNQVITINEHKAQVGVSIGVSYYPKGETETRDASTLLVEADKAMYQAKRAGRNRWHIYTGTM